MLKRLAVHPVQYALVGLALAFFYLLLLSLAEHVGFELAYLVSAGACVGLIGFYLCFVLRSVARGLGFSVGLAGLYGLLYGLLSAEDYALLMGSLLLFAVLAAVMVLTRRLDWYGVGRKDFRRYPPGPDDEGGGAGRRRFPGGKACACSSSSPSVPPLGLLVSGVILIFLLFFGKFGLIEYWIASGKPLAHAMLVLMPDGFWEGLSSIEGAAGNPHVRSFLELCMGFGQSALLLGLLLFRLVCWK